MVNEDEAEILARQEGLRGQGASCLHAVLGVTMIRTLGEVGIEWAGKDGSDRFAAAPVNVVDTHAASDCFVGVLAAALGRGDGQYVALAEQLSPRARPAAGRVAKTIYRPAPTPRPPLGKGRRKSR